MSPIALRLLEHAHGHAGVLATAALIHPAVILRRRARAGAMTSALVATALATLAALMGAFIYPSYRQLVKPALFATCPAVGWAFERKEHLGIAVVLLAWAGLGALWTEPRRASGAAPGAVRPAHLAYLAAATLATVTAALGVWVAAHATF